MELAKCKFVCRGFQSESYLVCNRILHMAIQYCCKCCGRVHDGIPAYHADLPAPYWNVPEDKRETDVFLTSDSCVIADRFFFVHGCIDIPIIATEEAFTWGVWISLREENFFLWQGYYETPKRSHIGPFFGWLCTQLPVYPNTLHLKTAVHLRDDGIRPYIELEATDHPLARDQREGITLDRVMEIIHAVEAMNANFDTA
jgi:hypothetical protein